MSDPDNQDDEVPELSVSGSDQVIAEALASVEGKGEKKSATADTTPSSPQFDALSSLLKQKDERLKEAHERLQRLAADFDNYKKRIKKEQEETTTHAHESFVRELLPIIDSFERTLEHAQEASEMKTIIEGIGLVHRQVLTYLDRLGVKPIQAIGQPFDPHFHEAVSQESTTEYPHLQVMKESQRGYMIRDRLLRPSRVVVSHHPAEKTSTQNSSQEEEDKDLKTGPDGITRVKC